MGNVQLNHLSAHLLNMLVQEGAVLVMYLCVLGAIIFWRLFVMNVHHLL